MSGKTIPAIKKPATSTNKSTGPEEASITTIKKATSKNLQGTATLTYHIGLDDTSALYWKIHANSGNGMFSNQWVAFADIQKALADWPDELPVTSTTLRPLLTGSVNTRRTRRQANHRKPLWSNISVGYVRFVGYNWHFLLPALFPPGHQSPQ
jgi:hypothetical protein